MKKNIFDTTVSLNFHGNRIDKFLQSQLKDLSRTKIQKSISLGYVFCNDIQVKSNYKVKPLDKITSKKILFNSKANFFDIMEFIATTPPNALTGSHAKAFLKDIS